MIKFTLKEIPTVPLEAENLSPDIVAPLDHAAIRALPVYLGKRRHALEDFFEVEGERSEELEIHGDLARVKHVGRAMTKGRVRVFGNAGMHLGALMRGGEIHVTGNASDWVGAEMSGGLIHVRGNAGGQIGAAYRGSTTGMRAGTILIEGSAGLEIGMRMKRGIIAIKQRVRDFAGIQMKGGTILLCGGAEIRTGAWMVRGTIISLEPLKLLPTFLYACRYLPNVLRMYSRHLAPFGFPLPVDEAAGSYERYSGDSATPGKGEILVWRPRGA